MNIADFNFIIFISNYILPDQTLVNYTTSKLECVMITIQTDGTSFFYNNDTEVCIPLSYNINSTQNLVYEDGFDYWITERDMISCQDVNSTYVNDASSLGDVNMYNTSYINDSSSVEDFDIYNTAYVNVSSCVDVKMCNSSYVDGEYWLYPPIYNYTRVKIFCHDLFKANPKNFITLPHLNVVRFPSGKYEGTGCNVSETAPIPENPGETEYHRVRLDLSTGGLVDTADQFTTQISGAVQKYGEAIACSGIHDYDTCPRRGHVLVDFRQTGFKLSPSNAWRTRYQVTHPEDCIIIEQSTYRFEAKGDGYCGGCRPRFKILVESDLSTAPPLSAAIMPQCD